MPYFPIFAEVTGDENWLKVYESTYDIINHFVSEYKTGILPDFVIRSSSGVYIPAPANFLESESDGNYSYNSCRTPWRISMDYLLNQNENALAFAQTINSFIMNDTGNDPWQIKAGYTPSGTAAEDYNDLCFVAPFLISSACEGETQWHDAVRESVLNYGDDVYFGDTIKMLCLIVDDGGWIVPEKQTVGDVNADGRFTTADLVMLQKWLLNAGSLTDWKAGDLCADGKINILDLCLMKRAFLSQAEQKNTVRVINTEELKAALAAARPGDEIVLAPGEYIYSGPSLKGRMFTGEADGTAEQKIVLRSEDPQNPAVLSGTTMENNYVLDYNRRLLGNSRPEMYQCQ